MLLCVTESPDSFIKVARVVALKIDRGQGGIRSEKVILQHGVIGALLSLKANSETATPKPMIRYGSTNANDKINPPLSGHREERADSPLILEG